MDYDTALAYDKKHDVFEPLCDAFERSGGCGHDLGITGALAIVKAWEKIRDAEKVKDLGYKGV
jgi:hypothetical protein